MIRLFLYICIFFCLSKPLLAFDKALNDFKQEIDEAIKEFEQEIQKLPKADSSIAESLFLAGIEFKELLQFTKESLNEENINATLDSIEFLGKNIDAAVKLIPPETLTSMEEVDFTIFEEKEMEMLNTIMTGMNRNKMADFKEMVTTMVVLEKQGFSAENFMAKMQDLDMGLAMLNDESIDIDFEIAGLSDKTLGDVIRELDQFDRKMQEISVEKITEDISKVSDVLGKKTSNVEHEVSNITSDVGTKMQESDIAQSAEEVTSSIAESGVAEVTEEVASTVSESNIAEVTEEVASTVSESNIAEVTEEVASSVSESNIAETIQETALVVEETLQTQVIEQVQEIAETVEEQIVEVIEVVQEQVEEVSENVRQTNYFSDSMQETLREWVNPNATCWIGDDGFSVQCDY